MRFAISRRAMPVAALAAAFALSTAAPQTRCEGATQVVTPFDTKGFPSTYIPSTDFFKAPKPMLLVGAGMRRKNFYIVEVDVYKTGLNLTAQAIERSKAALAKNASISDAIKAAKVIY